MREVDWENSIIRAAYFEWRVAKAYSTGVTVEVEPRRPRGRRMPADVEQLLSQVWPPGWFLREELGFDFDHAPSLAWTCRTLAHENAARAALAGSEVGRYTYPLVRK